MTTTLAIQQTAVRPLIKPEPRSPISIRSATERDLAFIDALQKKHSKMVGFASTTELQGHIDQQTALIAEEVRDQRSEVTDDKSDGVTGSLTSDFRPLSSVPVGYCLYKDRYFKREDCGIVSQLNVLPGSQRGLVGAALIQAMFERVPYGVRLFCCWCAQDLEANHFWEALGFVPLAFRAGSRGKEHGGRRKDGRVHIFWQRRVRRGANGEPDEVPGYPYWFPSQTSNGRLGEARLVLPIPPGSHWSDAMPCVLPGVLPGVPGEKSEIRGQKSEIRDQRRRKPKAKTAAPRAPGARPSQGLWFAPPPGSAPPPEMSLEKPKRQKPPRQKNDPKLIAAARELRDRYLEELNSGVALLPGGCGKYDVSRPGTLAAGSGGTGVPPVQISSPTGQRPVPPWNSEAPLLAAA